MTSGARGNTNRRTKSTQRGAALLIVLLLVASLSFVVLGLVERVSLSIDRTGGVALRNELMWRAVSAEAVAREVIATAKTENRRSKIFFSPDHPLFREGVVIPSVDGLGGELRFADAGRCFNVNVLSIRTEKKAVINELGLLFESLGAASPDALRIASVISDWVDDDDEQEARGAEDGFYTALPTPFRTGGGRIADISELRAMNGISKSIYDQIAPFLCALPDAQHAVINLNTLREIDAPLISAMTSGKISVSLARDVINARPPGGWASVDEFWGAPAFSDIEFDNQNHIARTDVDTQYFEVIGGASMEELDVSIRMIMSAPSNSERPILVSRTLGVFQ